MVSSREVHAAFHPEGKVTALGVSSDGDFAAWSEGAGSVFIASKVEDSMQITSEWKAPSFVRNLFFKDHLIYVLDDETGVTCLDVHANIVWGKTVTGGGFSLLMAFDGISILDGLGRLHMFGFDGSEINIIPQLENILLQQTVGEYLVVSFENGEVQALKDGQLVWSRPARGQTGESITCLGSTSEGDLVLGREGFALVAGDEEVLEIEVWSIEKNTLILREESSSRLLHAFPSPSGILCGFDSGKVSSLESYQTSPSWNEHFDCKYPIQCLTEVNGSIMATAWFYMYGLESDGPVWKIEHQGMPEMVSASSDGLLVLFAGEDQNDWTDAEPIGSFSLSRDCIEVESTDLNLWFNRPEAPVHLSAEELYRKDEEMESFFSKDELESMNSDTSIAIGIDELQDALGSEETTSQPVAQDVFLDVDTDALLEHLDDEISQMALLNPEHLLGELNAEAKEIITPRAVSGDDQRHLLGKDGAVVITLDGSDSFDPQNRIMSWSWVDDTGKEIADTSKVRVRISQGNHRFELRICDSEGQWSSDSLHVLIEA